MVWIAGSTPPSMAPGTVKRFKVPKAPHELLAVSYDLSYILSTIRCDTISFTPSPTAIVFRNDGEHPDLTIMDPLRINYNATRVTFWMAGGTVGFEYMITLLVSTMAGRVLERSALLKVMLR